MVVVVVMVVAKAHACRRVVAMEAGWGEGKNAVLMLVVAQLVALVAKD